jgi:hypothetical protein
MVETGIMKTEIVYSEDKTRRYRLTKIWDEKKPRAMVLMTNAGTADVVSIDYTTLYTVRNLNAIGFGSVDMLNMSSIITVKLEIPKHGEIVEESENITHILSTAEKADKVLIAWGKLGENNKKVKGLQSKILEKLRPFADKLHGITNDIESDEFYHPLAPQIRAEWVLKPLKLFEPPQAEPTAEEVKTGKKDKKKQSQTAEPADLPVPETKEDDKTEESA